MPTKSFCENDGLELDFPIDHYVRLQSQQGASQNANRDAEIDHNSRHVN